MGNKYTSLNWLLISLPFIAGCDGKNEKAETPNIILIMTDQQRGDCLGVMGNEGIKTPNIDRLANDGIIFENAYSSCPSSTPARAGLLTGMSPWNHGMIGYGTMAEKYKYEMPVMLANAGYYTFAIGKLHYAPQRNLHGFHGALLDESGRVHTPDFESDYRKWFREKAPGINPDSTGLGWNEHNAKPYVLPEELHPTTWTSNEAIEFIKQYDKKKPFFLKVSFARPHSPYDPPKRFVELYNDDDIKKPYKSDWSEIYADRPNIKDASFGDFGEEHAIESRKHYYASITFIDEKVGLIIDELKRKDMYDNSIILFTSDHGDMLGDHNHWRKTYPYEGSTHIPFIVKFPKNISGIYTEGSKIRQTVELRDVLPTFLETAKAEIQEGMDGMSLYRLYMEEKPKWREYIDMEHTNYRDYKDWYALTDGYMKYIYFASTGEEQLFDISKDKTESKDLSSNKKYMEVMEKWRKRLKCHLEERDSRFISNGEIVKRDNSIVYTPNYPGQIRNIEK